MPANASYMVSGYCHGGRDQAAVLIFNAETSVRRTFVVHSLYFREAQPTPVAMTLWNVYRTTAQSEGDAVRVDALDTSSAALPSQVQIAVNPLVTVGSYVYGRWQAPTNVSAAVGVPCIGGMSPQTGWVRTDASTVHDSRGFSDTQSIVLREGEGLAFVNPSATDSPQPASWQLLANIRVGSATYSINTTIAPIPSYASFGIHNGTGSGVVVEVLSIQLTNVGPPTVATILADAPTVRLTRIFGFDGGEALTPVSLGGAPVPPQLKVQRHQDWAQLNVGLNTLDSSCGLGPLDLGLPGTAFVTLAQQRQLGTFRHFLSFQNNLFNVGGAPGTGLLATSYAQGQGNNLSFSGGSQDLSRIRLNPGEGLALIVDNSTTYATYWFEAEITHEPPQVSGTSPTGYSS